LSRIVKDTTGKVVDELDLELYLDSDVKKIKKISWLSTKLAEI